MIRISENLLIQKVTDKHIVIGDESTGEEVALSEDEAIRAAQVIMHLFDVKSIVLGDVETADAAEGHA